MRIRTDSLISFVLRILFTSIKIGSRDKSHSPKDICIYSWAFVIHFFLSSKKMHSKYKKSTSHIDSTTWFVVEIITVKKMAQNKTRSVGTAITIKWGFYVKGVMLA